MSEFDHMSTQTMRRRAADLNENTDRRKINDLLWGAIEKNATSAEDHGTRLTKIETAVTLLKWLVGVAIGVVTIVEMVLHK